MALLARKKNRRRNKTDFTADMIVKNRKYDKYAKLKDKKKNHETLSWMKTRLK